MKQAQDGFVGIHTMAIVHAQHHTKGNQEGLLWAITSNLGSYKPQLQGTRADHIGIRA